MSRIGTVLLICFLYLSAAPATAQEWIGVNRDENGKVVRGSYLTNEWFDNWYLGVAGGVQGDISSISTPKISPEVEVNILKWFTPSIGARFGYQGLSNKEWLDTYAPLAIHHSALPFTGEYGGSGTLSYGFAYFHGDLLWNLSNALFGYKYRRFYNASLYANAGYVRLYDNSDGGDGIFGAVGDNEIGFGVGLLNTFRLAERFAATIDLRDMNMSSRYKTSSGIRTHVMSVSLGLSYNIYRTYWNRASAIIADTDAANKAADRAQKALEAAKAERDAMGKQLAEKDKALSEMDKELEQKEKELAAANDKLSKVTEIPYDDLKKIADAAEMVVFFYIDKDELNFSELHHLDQYIQATLKTDPNHKFYLTGSADKGTGSMSRNEYLCSARAECVKDILVNDYKVKPENVIIKATVVTDKHLDGALDRCCIIEKQ